jgi:hypothetical protein
MKQSELADIIRSARANSRTLYVTNSSLKLKDCKFLKSQTKTPASKLLIKKIKDFYKTVSIDFDSIFVHDVQIKDQFVLEYNNEENLSEYVHRQLNYLKEKDLLDLYNIICKKVKL